MNLAIMAWKNLWRSRSRTLITAAAVFFAVILSTFTSSMQEGTYAKMIDNVVKSYTGYVQVHQNGYWENKTINNTFEASDSLSNQVLSVHGVKQVIPRLESFTLLSYQQNTKAAAVIGIDPVKENNMTGLARWVKEGKYLESDDDGILVAYNLAKNLEVSVGDTLVLLSQGYHGATAAGLFPVKGIIKFPAPQLNNLGVYITLPKAQEFYSAYNRLTSYSVMAANYRIVNRVQSHIEKLLSDKYEVMTWEEMNPELVQLIESDRGSGVIMKAILYLVVGFGILGTIIMMIAERKRELGVMVAVGMKKIKLVVVLFFETLYIGILGVLAGFLASVPLIFYLVENPIPIPPDMAEMYEIYGFEPYMFFSSIAPVFYNQLITVFIITIIISFYPMINIGKFKVINALRA